MKSLTHLCFYLTILFNCHSQQEPDLVITNVNIVDVQSGTLLESPKDVVVNDGKIHSIVEPSRKRPKATQTIDGSGKYLIPGLWDMHTHPDDPEMWRMEVKTDARDLLMPLFVIHGVTGTRDMAGDMNVVKSWRAKIKKGELLGPEIVAGGPLIDGPNPMWDGSIGIPSIGEVKRKVDSLKNSGVDFLKIYSLLPDTIFFALGAYASSIDFPFVGHVPFTVTTAEASDAGMKSLEHLLNILADCSSDQEAIYANTIDYKGITNPLTRYVYKQDYTIQTYDREKADRLFEKFVANDTWHTPTISMWYKNAYFESEVMKDSVYYKYLPPYMRKYWKPEVNDHLQRRHPDFIGIKQRLVKKYMEVIDHMNQAGVKLLAGTDIGANPLCFPGLSLHYELEMLVKAGLTPAEALRTATINPALFLEIETQYGSVEVGKVADLVLLEENPLESITNTRGIEAVIRNGGLLTKYDLAARLKQIELSQKMQSIPFSR